MPFSTSDWPSAPSGHTLRNAVAVAGTKKCLFRPRIATSLIRKTKAKAERSSQGLSARVAQLLVPVDWPAFWRQIEQIPDRLKRANVAGILPRVGRRVKQL